MGHTRCFEKREKHINLYLLTYLLICLLTCLLTLWCRVLLEKLTGLQLVKKFPAFYGTRRFINALTSVRHLSLSWASPIQSSGLFCLQRKHPACKCFLTGLFYREGLLAPRPTPKLEDHPLSAVHDCLFNLFAATLHIGGRSSIRNLRMRHAVVTGTHYIELIHTVWVKFRILNVAACGTCIYI